MGKFEEEDSRKVLAGKPVMRGTSQPRTLWEMFVMTIAYPYRAWKEKKRQEELRKSLFRVSEDKAFNEVEEQNYLATLDRLIDETNEENKGDK